MSGGKSRRKDRLLELLRVVVPELADVRIALDRRIDELAGFLLDLANVDREGEIAVVVELDRPARRVGERDALDRGGQLVGVGVAAGGRERRLQDLAVDVKRRSIEAGSARQPRSIFASRR